MKLAGLLVVAALLGAQAWAGASDRSDLNGDVKEVLSNLKGQNFSGVPAVPGAALVQPPLPQAFLSPEDAKRIEALIAALFLIHQSQDLWPGYDIFFDQMLFGFTDKLTVLINCSNPPKGFLPYTGRLPSGSPTVYVLNAKPDVWMPVFGFITFNGRNTFAVEDLTFWGAYYRPGLFPIFVAHEIFHVKAQHGWNLPPRIQTKEYPETDAGNLALAQLEQKLLGDALSAPDDGAAGEKAKDFLSIRDYRYQNLDPEFVKVETLIMESFEGMAHYLDMRLKELLLKHDPSLGSDFEGTISFCLETDLLRKLTESDMSQERYYSTGAAQGILLDRFKVPMWKLRVEKGEAATQILEDRFLLSKEEKARRAQAVLKKLPSR